MCRFDPIPLWSCERLSNRLDEWAFLDVLERIGHLAVVVAVVFYILEAPERRKVKEYYAWQIINSLRGSHTDGGRRHAIQDLLRNRVSLAGIELVDAILPHMNFRNADLREGRFERGQLVNADFRFAVLSSSRFNGTLLDLADFSRADLKEVDFSDAHIEKANFSHADLQEANLYKTGLKQSVFTDSNLAHAILERADLTGVTFRRANLRRARLEKADVNNTDFYAADLRDAVLRDCVNWTNIQNIRLANIARLVEPPPGFPEWAREHGAVEIADEGEWRRRIDREKQPE